jgi:hypothetical protein
MLPKAPLRRLSRPQLARESYNGGEAKCRLSLAALGLLRARLKEASGSGRCTALRSSAPSHLPHRALYDLVRAAGAPADSWGQEPKTPKAAVAMQKVCLVFLFPVRLGPA